MKNGFINKPSGQRKPISIKRLRSEDNARKGVIDLTGSHCCGKEISLEDASKFSKSQSVLHEEHFQSPADLKILERVGKVATTRYMQVQAARLLYIGHGMEVEALEEEKSEKSKKSESLEKSIEREKKLQLALEQVALKEREGVLLKEEIEDLKAEREMFAIAWDRAKAQAELFAPGVKFDDMDPLKVVYKGKLIDDDQVHVEGSDDHNPAE
ncbi:hypothetical protein PIB30_078063 [Stylosanthes scabra]|uniref:Uncharacterized protein n=1 Tax=Stylosanthes scabra TaxID=79078 RepID=A0ABU6TQB7_9FABA|nr:hypothetical protein [Stylosanthes scabra]